MEKTNEYCEFKKPIIKENINEYNSNFIYYNKRKEKLANDLKLKGFNEKQITDIFETLTSNNLDNENLKKEEEDEKHQSLHADNYINNCTNNNLNNNIFSTLKEVINNKDELLEFSNRNNLKSNLINNNSFNTNNNNSKIKYMKVNLNISSKKYKSLNNKKNNNNIPYNKKKKNFILKKPIISDRNQNFKNSLKNYNSQYSPGDIFNPDKKIEVNKNELIKKIGDELNEINYKKYNFKKEFFDKIEVKENMEKNKNTIKSNNNTDYFIKKNIIKKKETSKTTNIKEKNNCLSTRKRKIIMKTQNNTELKEKDKNNSFSNQICKKNLITHINTSTKKVREIRIPKDIIPYSKINQSKYNKINSGSKIIINLEEDGIYGSKEDEFKTLNKNNITKIEENITIKGKKECDDDIEILKKNIFTKENNKIIQKMGKQYKIVNNIDKNRNNGNKIKDINTKNRTNDLIKLNKENNKIIKKDKEFFLKNQDEKNINQIIKKNINVLEIKESNIKDQNNDEERINFIFNDSNNTREYHTCNEIFNKNKKNKDINKILSRDSVYTINNRNLPLFTSRNRNIFLIRKQKNDKEDMLSKKNIAIIEVKVNSRSCYTTNYKIKDNYPKPKTLSRQISTDSHIIQNSSIEKNSKRNNSNHTFVNINLCKDQDNSSVIYINREMHKNNISNRENSCINLTSKIPISNRDNSKIKNNLENLNTPNISNIQRESKNKINKLNKANSDLDNNNIYNNHTIYRSYNLRNTKSENKRDRNIININEEEKENFNVYVNKTKSYDNGKYEGIMLNNKREIKGIMIYDNGAKYEGQWRNDKKHGKGVFISSHYFDCKNKVGMKYEGEFRNDKIEGIGIGTYSNGDKYEGEWKNNKQYGRGKVSYMGGSRYEGEWKNGKFDGFGIFYLKNGEKFEGKFSESKYNGYGKYYYINGDYLEGIFKNDRPSGLCLLHKIDGSIAQVNHP